jgi:phosphoglycerol transferase MdoB-like AlkP superfamily enzyme
VLVLQLGALDEWVSGAMAGGRELTPFLDGLARRGLFYPHIYDAAAAGQTADREYMVLSSNHPLPDGAVALRAPDNHLVTLATALRDAGYSTLSMHAERPSMWNRAVLYPRYGFTQSRFAEEPFFANLSVVARKTPVPWLIYATAEGLTPSAESLDDGLARLFADLQADDLLRDTVVVLYGDHPARLHPTAGPLERMPMILVMPGMDTPALARASGGQIDIAPTLLHYLGIEPPRSFTGRALLPEDVRGFVARWDGSFVSPPLMFDARRGDCRVVSDLRTLPPERCRELAGKAHEQLDASWLVLEGDLAPWLVDRARPLPPAPTWEGPVTLGGGCQKDDDCAMPEPGFLPRCHGGICMSEPLGVCDHPGSSAPCAPGSGCSALRSGVNLCAAECDAFACAGRCNELSLCMPLD